MKRPEFIARHFPDSALLGEARAWTRANWTRGCICPLCKGKVKRYARPLHASMAASLIRLYRQYGKEWGQLDPVLNRRLYADNAKLRWWGLLEPQEGEREDGSKRIGVWRVTDKGEQFVLGRVRVQRRALVYKNALLSFEGEAVSIVECLGERFDYRKLMEGDE